MSHPTQTQANRAPWNNRRRSGPKPPLKLREIWAIRIRLQLAKHTRDLALFKLAIDRLVVATQLGSVVVLEHAGEFVKELQELCGGLVGEFGR